MCRRSVKKKCLVQVLTQNVPAFVISRSACVSEVNTKKKPLHATFSVYKSTSSAAKCHISRATHLNSFGSLPSAVSVRCKGGLPKVPLKWDDPLCMSSSSSIANPVSVCVHVYACVTVSDTQIMRLFWSFCTRQAPILV